MLPVVALVGRPNVGKSTLFNALTRTRDALVADVPGVTRDRQYGYGKVGPAPYVVIDTGGIVEQPAGIEAPMRQQTERAVAEADVLVLIVDARSGITAQDEFIARLLRRAGKRVVLAANKAEGLDSDVATAEFHGLGFGEPVPLSAAHGQGARELMEVVLGVPDAEAADDEDRVDAGAPVEPVPDVIRVAIIGRPNVGKSTLVNRLLGEERVIASDMPGTTRDSIFVPFSRDGRNYELIDTAGDPPPAKNDVTI